MSLEAPGTVRPTAPLPLPSLEFAVGNVGKAARALTGDAGVCTLVLDFVASTERGNVRQRLTAPVIPWSTDGAMSEEEVRGLSVS